MLVRVMEMAMWSSIICLPFLIMYLSLCPIDCGHWMLSLNQFFLEEKWFVYEQSLPLLSMTAPAAVLKWIRMKPETTGVYRAGNLFSACSNHSIRHACLFSNRTACHAHVGLQAQYFLTVTYSSSFSRMKVISETFYPPNTKSTEVGIFLFVQQQRITLKWFNNMTAGEMWNFDRWHNFYKPNNFLPPSSQWPKWADQNVSNVWHMLLVATWRNMFNPTEHHCCNNVYPVLASKVTLELPPVITSSLKVPQRLIQELIFTMIQAPAPTLDRIDLWKEDVIQGKTWVLTSYHEIPIGTLHCLPLLYIINLFDIVKQQSGYVNLHTTTMILVTSTTDFLCLPTSLMHFFLVFCIGRNKERYVQSSRALLPPSGQVHSCSVWKMHIYSYMALIHTYRKS